MEYSKHSRGRGPHKFIYSFFKPPFFLIYQKIFDEKFVHAHFSTRIPQVSSFFFLRYMHFFLIKYARRVLSATSRFVHSCTVRRRSHISGNHIVGQQQDSDYFNLRRLCIFFRRIRNQKNTLNERISYVENECYVILRSRPGDVLQTVRNHRLTSTEYSDRGSRQVLYNDKPYCFHQVERFYFSIREIEYTYNVAISFFFPFQLRTSFHNVVIRTWILQLILLWKQVKKQFLFINTF